MQWGFGLKRIGPGNWEPTEHGIIKPGFATIQTYIDDVEEIKQLIQGKSSVFLALQEIWLAQENLKRAEERIKEILSCAQNRSRG